jgi:transposase
VCLRDVPCFVGIDVAKAQRDSALRPAGERWAVPHEASGVATLVDQLQVRHPSLIVLDATGGLERAVTRAWATAGLPVVVVHPRQGRDCARATGQLAPTEAWDARALAHLADVSRPRPRPLPDAQTQALRALLGRRQPLLGRRTAAQHRLAGTSGCLAQAIAAHSAWRTTRLAMLDHDLATLRRASPRWRDNNDLLQSVPGMGPVWARTWLLALPELGTRTRQPMAALVGVAPLNGASGTLRGRRTMWGGRGHGHPVLSMGRLVATRCHPQITAFSQRLRAAGQRQTVALTACRHKLVTMRNAMLKHRKAWQAQEVQNSKYTRPP